MESITQLHGLVSTGVSAKAGREFLARDAAPAIAIPQLLNAVGEPESLKELGQRLSAALAMCWPDVSQSEVFFLEGAAGLQPSRGGLPSQLLLTALEREWARLAPSGVMVLRPILIVSDSGGVRGCMMSVPLMSGAVVEGVLVVQKRIGEFASRDLSVLSEIASAVVPLLPRVRARGQRAAAWADVDMTAARQVQRRFLPPSMDLHAGRVRVVGKYLPAFAVGGDFYDVVDLGDGNVFVAIGDVSGKGVTAALMMARVSAELRRWAIEGASPSEILTRLNRSLPAWMSDDRFVTIACARLDLAAGEWTMANAGHVLPLLRRQDGSVAAVARLSGPPIGILPGAVYEHECFRAEGGDILLLTTDGVSEVFAAESDFQQGTLPGFGPGGPTSTGEASVRRLVEEGPHDVCELSRLIAQVAERTSFERDDVAILGLQLAQAQG